MHLSPEEEARIRRDFDTVVNMTPDTLRSWLETPESKKVGYLRRGETKSVGRQSARRIFEIRAAEIEDLTDADYRHMKQGDWLRSSPSGPAAMGRCHQHPLALVDDELGR